MKTKLTLLVPIILLLIGCAGTNDGSEESVSAYVETKYKLPDLIKQTNFYKNLSPALLDSLIAKGSVMINNFLPVTYKEENQFASTISILGDGDQSNYDFLMIDGDKGVLLMHLWRDGIGMDENGNEIELKESYTLKVFELIDEELVETTKNYFKASEIETPFDVAIDGSNPKEIELNGRMIEWDGETLRTKTQREFLSMYFSGFLDADSIQQLLQSGKVRTETGGTITYIGDQSFCELNINSDGKKVIVKQFYAPDGSITSYGRVPGSTKREDQKIMLAALEKGKLEDVTAKIFRSSGLRYFLGTIERHWKIKLENDGLFWIEGRTYRFLNGQLNDGISQKNKEDLTVHYFDEPFKADDLQTLLTAFGRRDTLAEKDVESLYPEQYKLNLFDEYIGYFWDGNERVLGINDIQAHDAYQTGDHLLLHYSLPVEEQEGITGRKHIIRVVANDIMIMEFRYNDGGGSGALPSTHTVDISLVPGGFLKYGTDVTHFPGAFMWNSAVNLDLYTTSGQKSYEYIGISERGPFKYYSSSSETVTFSPSKDMINRIGSGSPIEEILSNGVPRKEDVSIKDRMHIATTLAKVKKDTVGELSYLTAPFDHEKVMESLEVESYALKDTINEIAIYEATIRADKTAVIFFNTLNFTYRAGDAEDDLYQQLLRIDGKAPHFGFLSGFIKEMKDITGDGLPEIIISSVSNYRTDYQGSVDIYQINEYNELVEIDVPRLDVNFTGGDCENIEGYNSAISFEENRLKLVLSNGSYGCADQQYEERTIYYEWDPESEEFKKATKIQS